MSESFDVAIVGYGPVGQVLAILLGQYGWRVGVFEKQPAAYPLPRAVHFDHEVARILQGAGIGDELPRLTEPAYVYEWRNAKGEILLLIGSKSVSLSGWPEANMFAQPDLEAALHQRVCALPCVTVHRGCEVTAVRETGDHVELSANRANGRSATATARYVVGCDGANSFVRTQIGATVTDLGFFFDWLIVDVVLHEQRVWDPINWQLCDPARPTTLVSGGPGRRRWEFMRLPGQPIDDLNNEQTTWRLLAPWDITPRNATLERHTVYTFQARWVDMWRNGRVLLAGDAAHQMPPFAGQGMCAGIRDAANLAWKLDLVLAGKTPDAVLDTYATERIPQVQQVINFSIELGKVICVADPDEAAARDAAMTATAKQTGLAPPLPAPAIGPGLLLNGDPLAGQLFVQGEVQRGTMIGRFDDVVGRSWTLISTSCDPATQLDADAAAFFASIGGISAHVGPDGPIRDVAGSYARWFATTRTAVALQRPDFHVFGTSASAHGARELVTHLRRALGCGHTS